MRSSWIWVSQFDNIFTMDLNEKKARMLELWKSDRPYIRESLQFDDNQQIIRLIQAIIPETKNIPGDMFKVIIIDGGCTNKLKKVEFLDNSHLPLLIRLFGGEQVIDRDIENPTFEAVVKVTGAVQYYGRFTNGRIEGWLNGYRALAPEDFWPTDSKTRNMSKQIARSLAQIHQLKLPEALNMVHDRVTLWDQIWEWYAISVKPETRAAVLAHAQDLERQSLEKTMSQIEFDNIKINLERLQEKVYINVSLSKTMCFCHNDAQPMNIMYREDPSDIRLIDYEYGALNYRGFDIANHFNEYAGGLVNGLPDYSKLPTLAQQETFCKAYLEAMLSRPPTAEELSDLASEVQDFLGINNYFWGLWSVVQAVTEGYSVFPYLTYAKERLLQGNVESSR